MQQSADQIDLMKHCLTTRCNILNERDLLMCAQHHRCEGIGDATSIEQMCAALGRHYGDDAASAIEASRSEKVAKDACDDIVNDPVTEAIYAELDPDDKT